VSVVQPGGDDPAGGSGETAPVLATPLPQTVTTPAASGGLSLVAISGLLLILLAVVFLGALIFLLLRQPARG
jgi:hypothetical protein